MRTVQYLALIISTPFPKIDIDVVVEQSLDTLSTALTNSELEKSNVIRSEALYYATMMR